MLQALDAAGDLRGHMLEVRPAILVKQRMGVGIRIKAFSQRLVPFSAFRLSDTFGFLFCLLPLFV